MKRLFYPEAPVLATYPQSIMTNKTFTLFFMLVFYAFTATALADKIYKCKSATGVLIYSSSPCPSDVESIHSWTVIPKIRPPQVLVIKQNTAGQYMSQGSVNEQSVAFIVDTGASKVSLPPAVAQAANLSCQGQVTIHTANGSSQACSVIIPRFKFGSFERHNVSAIIAPNLSQPLLGMNVLQDFKIKQELGEMHISERH